MRALLSFLLLLSLPLSAATTIDAGSTVLVPQLKRFGISGISHYYYDRVLMKNLIWRNAGFEGLIFQSVMRCNSDMTATGCVDTNPYTQWTTGMWNGATYEFILGTAKGRTGTIATYTRPPADQTAIASSWTFADSGTVPAQGDYFVARRATPGGAEMGWNIQPIGGATVATETADLPPGTAGRQSLRVSASAAGQGMQISTPFGWHANQTFVVLNGTFRISFKAKLLAGASSINVQLARNGAPLKSENVPLSASWQNYDIDFSIAESGTPQGFLTLGFNVNGSSLLLDEVSLVQTNGDVTNTSAFRDPVVAAIRGLNPGSLKIHVLDLGDSIDDLIAPPFARRRTAYQAATTNNTTNQYGWQEFLELCELVGAEPYLILPVATSETETRNALEWLGGPSTSPYGARRAARGRSAPWTDAFQRIHIEYSNEAWNPVFLGGTLFAADYGRRGNDLFAVARQSPYYSAKYNLILGVQAANPFNSRVTHNASANHDSLSIGPYIGTNVDEAPAAALFAGLFTESSFWSMAANGPVKQTYDFINGTSRPVPLMVYEVNLHTTGGTISQASLDSFTPSIGAGVAVGNHMMNMLREQKIRDQLVFSLGGYRFDRTDGKTSLIWSITRDMGVSDRKRPQYLVVKLLNEILAGDLVQTTQTGDNPKWDQPLTNGRIEMNNIPFVQSYATVNGSRKAVVIFNMHRTTALDVTVTGTNAPRGTVTMKRVASANITDNNEASETVAITTQQLANFSAAQTLTLPPFSMTVLTSDSPARLRGDVNGNGNVTAFDASLVLQSVVGAAPLTTDQVCAGDYNANGSVSAFDASLILQCVVSGSCSTSACN